MFYPERRKKLASLLPDAGVLLASGNPPSRNYAAIRYPFRPSSHALHFCGKLPAGSFVFIGAARATLFIEEVTPAEEVWHGKGVDRGRLKAVGEFDEVLTTAELPNFLKRYAKTKIFSLPLTDVQTNIRLTALLGRPLDSRGEDLPLAKAVAQCRSFHDTFAIEEIRKAAAATNDVFRIARLKTVVGAKEYEIAAELEYQCAVRGCSWAFPPIVTTRGEVLHAEPSESKLEAGKLLLVDFGAESPGGYASDVTRVWPVQGEYDRMQREVYEIVLAAKHRATEMIRPGIRYRDVHIKACEVLAEGLVALGLLDGRPLDLVERGAHALFFPHGIGHLLGLDVHDMEDLGDVAGYEPGRERSSQFGLNYLRLDRDLHSGMAVTIEPGLYFIPAILQNENHTSKFKDCLKLKYLSRFKNVGGIRLEDDILVTPDGHENLTRALPDDADFFCN